MSQAQGEGEPVALTDSDTRAGADNAPAEAPTAPGQRLAGRHIVGCRIGDIHRIRAVAWSRSAGRDGAPETVSVRQSIDGPSERFRQISLEAIDKSMIRPAPRRDWPTTPRFSACPLNGRRSHRLRKDHPPPLDRTSPPAISSAC